MRRNPDPYLAKARRDEAEAAFSELLAKLRAGKAKLLGKVNAVVIVDLKCGLPVHLKENPDMNWTGQQNAGAFDEDWGHMIIYDLAKAVGPFGKYKTPAFLFRVLATAIEDSKDFQRIFTHEFVHFQRWSETGREKSLEIHRTRYPANTPFVYRPKYASDPHEHEARFQASIRNIERYLDAAVARDDTEDVFATLGEFGAFIRKMTFLPGADPDLAAELTPVNPLYRNAIRWFAVEYQRLKAEYADAYADGKAKYENAPKGENDREW